MLFRLIDVLKRYESYGWHVQTVADVNDLDAVRTAILNAKAESSKPSIIKVYYVNRFLFPNSFVLMIGFVFNQIRTVIGHGSSKEGSHGVHGAPLGTTDLKSVKAKFGFNPDEVRFPIAITIICSLLKSGNALFFLTFTFSHSLFPLPCKHSTAKLQLALLLPRLSGSRCFNCTPRNIRSWRWTSNAA